MSSSYGFWSKYIYGEVYLAIKVYRINFNTSWNVQFYVIYFTYDDD